LGTVTGIAARAFRLVTVILAEPAPMAVTTPLARRTIERSAVVASSVGASGPGFFPLSKPFSRQPLQHPPEHRLVRAQTHRRGVILAADPFRVGIELRPAENFLRRAPAGHEPGVEADRAVERLVVLDVEFQLQAGEIGLRQVLQPDVVEVVVSAPPAQHGEVLCCLEDPRNGYAGLRGIVERGGRGAPGEALQLEVPARVEDVECFGAHRVAVGGTGSLAD